MNYQEIMQDNEEIWADVQDQMHLGRPEDLDVCTHPNAEFEEGDSSVGLGYTGTTYWYCPDCEKSGEVRGSLLEEVT